MNEWKLKVSWTAGAGGWGNALLLLMGYNKTKMFSLPLLWEIQENYFPFRSLILWRTYIAMKIKIDKTNRAKNIASYRHFANIADKN